VYIKRRSGATGSKCVHFKSMAQNIWAHKKEKVLHKSHGLVTTN